MSRPSDALVTLSRRDPAGAPGDAPPERRLEPPLRLGVSACLLGEEVRFDGGHKKNSFLIHGLGPYVEWFPVCPEVEIGMGTPRETIRLVGERGDPQLVGHKSGRDYAPQMTGWSRANVEEIASWDLHGYVLKSGSPSCGLFRVRVYPPEGGMPERSGRGVFARELTRRLPMLPVEEEGRLNDLPLRENFIERLFAYERWTRFLRQDPTPRGLVAFHTAHKMALLAHSPALYRRLGRLVAEAGAGKRPFDELVERYARSASEALRILASRGRHSNVLQHLMGFLKDHLGRDDKAELVQTIDDYRDGLVPLVVPLTLLNHHVRRHPVPEWVHRQVYLKPYPKELMLRNHV